MTIMGCDPHLDTFDVAVIDSQGAQIDSAHLTNDTAGWSEAARLAVTHGVERVGIEAASGYGRHVGAVIATAGIAVFEIPTRLTARMRLRDGGAKTDTGDARAVARLIAAGEGTRWCPDDDAEALRLLVHRRNSLVRTQTREINHMRALLAELDPTAASTMGRIRSRRTLEQFSNIEGGGSEHARTASSLIRHIADDAVRRHDQIRQLDNKIDKALPEPARRLINTMPGAGLITVATLLAEMAGTDRFATDAKMAAWAGTAPLDASSGRQQRHRLNRQGNRQANWAIHMIALTQTARPGPARDYIIRRTAEGKTRTEALRALKRHITRTIWKTLN